MSQSQLISGFSKLQPEQKRVLVQNLFENPAKAANVLRSFLYQDADLQALLSELSENTITNFPLPYNVAPNFLINGKWYMVPMVTEESSVVAAASAGARFWADRGGFSAKTLGTQKTGQVHFLFRDDDAKLTLHSEAINRHLRLRTAHLTEKMEKRGGGITELEILNRTCEIKHYYQLHVTFETADAMGANFINSVLEECALALGEYFENTENFDPAAYEPVMSILSNHVPGCLVEVVAECPVRMLDNITSGLSGWDFARRFSLAVEIAEKDIYRATTHNKGIMNGVDAVIIATGNDFRAIEAGAHAFASQTGRYTCLSKAEVHNGIFRFTLTMPLAVGTVGGLTKNHPLAALSLSLLGNPSAPELMQIAAAAG
ncbi:MAG TPA: hypothetical protein VLH61_02255, partial [Bacteroidales bacterium]|nr:hypothetical protein [Bacteroidales bacterium]